MSRTVAPSIAGLTPRPRSSEDLYRGIVHAWYTKKYLPALHEKQDKAPVNPQFRGKRSLNYDTPDLGVPIPPELPRPKTKQVYPGQRGEAAPASGRVLVADASMTKEESALLDAIAKTESAGSWNVIYGGDTFDDYSKHPAKFVTIKSGPNEGKKSSAAGKYQITKTTYDRVAPKLGITDFSPESQQKIALYLAREKYGPNLAKDLAAGKAADAAAKLAGVWTSLPGGIEAGTSSNKFLNSYAAALNAPRPPGFIPDVASETDNGVAQLQQQLQQRGFSPGAIDGIAGPKTKAAIKAFQQANGLTADGIVGPKTMAALQQPSTPGALTQTLGGAGVPAAFGARTNGYDRSAYATGDGMDLYGADNGVLSNDQLMRLGQPAGMFDPVGTGPNRAALSGALYPVPRPVTEAQTRGEQRQLVPPSAPGAMTFKPLPAPAPLVPPQADSGNLGLGNLPGFGPHWGTLNNLKDLAAGIYDRPAPPVPMPGRPAGLSGAAPMPPAMPAKTQTAPPATPKLLRLPSGAMIAPGVYDNAKSGIPYTVTEGPNGTAVIHSQRSGFVDLGKEINAPTILGGIIRSKIPEVAQSAVENFGPALDNVKNTAANAINTVAPAVQGLGNTVGGFFGGLFGGGQPVPQVPPGMLGRNPAGGMYRPPMPLTPSPMLRSGARPAVPQPPPAMTATQRRQAQQDDWARRGLNEFGMLS